MKIITQTKKVIIENGVEVEIFIPQVQSFYFETFIRRSICITPIWTTWNVEEYNKPEEIYELSVVCVYLSHETKIEYSYIRISEIQAIYNREKSDTKSLIEFLRDTDKYDVRTKERFLEDYKKAISKFDEIIL